MIAKTLRQLNIIPFLEILDTNNYFLIDSEYLEEKVYTEQEKDEIETTWYKLYDEYFLIENDHTAKSFLSNQKKLYILETQIAGLTTIHDKLASLLNFKFTEEVAETKLTLINSLNEIEPRLKLIWTDEIHEVCNKVESVIKLLNNQLQDLKGAKKDKVEKKKRNVYDIIAMVEQSLQRSLGDVSKINVEQFLSYKKIAKEIVEKNNKK